MALIVEDGTGKSDAESYISAADADTWVVARYGATDAFAAASAGDQERFLRLGVEYLEAHYVGMWSGVRMLAAQALSWPRAGVTDEDGYDIAENVIPADVIAAQVEAARRYASGTDPMADQDRGGAVKRERVEGAIDVEYFEGARPGTTIPVINNRLKPYLTNGGSDYVGIMERG